MNGSGGIWPSDWLPEFGRDEESFTSSTMRFLPNNFHYTTQLEPFNVFHTGSPSVEAKVSFGCRNKLVPGGVFCITDFRSKEAVKRIPSHGYIFTAENDFKSNLSIIRISHRLSLD